MVCAQTAQVKPKGAASAVAEHGMSASTFDLL
jgi:hypothetical protein